ncbi:MAG: U32 family peptidase [Candidatus Gastranaerophilales bacterium]|nr:U32 family peptidase [Candidatus Gastranaerophilales bacterium]
MREGERRLKADRGQRPGVELLAPAGNREGFLGAIHAGADAVYLGGSRFGARAYADNFTSEELTACIRYAHLWGRKVYLTVNTLIKECEFADLYPYLLPVYEAGLDGVIVQDIGVLAAVRACFPDLEIHGSTQMTLCGEYGAALLKKMGVCRIVPSRELSLRELIRIKERTGLAIECFIHGAMCYSYSGQCLFSSILGGRSGNRGRCAQPCRLPYTVEGCGAKAGACHPLSLKDMCTIERIPELIEAGIDSFKIEGRMKKPEYAAGVTAIYRKYIDRYYENRSVPLKVEEADLRALSSLYIRSERQDGYYDKYHGKDMVTLENPSYGNSDESLLERIRQDYLQQKPRIPVRISASFQTGYPAEVTFSADGRSVTVSGETVQAADKRPITKENLKKQLGKLGDGVFTAAQTDDLTVSPDAFYSLKSINELRRRAAEALENALIEGYSLPLKRPRAQEAKVACSAARELLFVRSKNARRLNLSVRTAAQLQAALKISAQSENSPWGRVYIDGDLLCGEAGVDFKEIENNYEACRLLAGQSEVIITLPYVIRAKDDAYLHQIGQLFDRSPAVFAGVLVRSLDGIGWFERLKADRAGKADSAKRAEPAKKAATRLKCYGDAGLYVWNRKTLEVWEGTLDGFCLPFELKGPEQKCLTDGPIPCEKVVYGRIPMMIAANCVVNTTSGCRGGRVVSPVWLTDRYQKKFPVELNCAHCMNIIYNSVPLSLHRELAKWEQKADCRINLTVEDARESESILKYFVGLQAIGSSSERPPFFDYTTGHERRGVE